MDEKNFLAALMKELNCDLSSLHNRIIFQKKMYLLREMGFPLKYNFNWWRFGPYSSKMSDTAFSITNFENTSITFDSSLQKILDKFREFSKDKENNLEFFEIAACILYLKQVYSENFLDELKKRKSSFSDEDVNNVINYLKKFNFL